MDIKLCAPEQAETLALHISGFIFELFEKLSLDLDEYADNIEKNNDWFAHVVLNVIFQYENKFEIVTAVKLVEPPDELMRHENKSLGNLNKKIHDCINDDSSVQKCFNVSQYWHTQKKFFNQLGGNISTCIGKCFEEKNKHYITFPYHYSIGFECFYFLHLVIDESRVKDIFKKMPSPDPSKIFCFAEMLWTSLYPVILATPARQYDVMDPLHYDQLDYMKIFHSASAELLATFVCGQAPSTSYPPTSEMARYDLLMELFRHFTKISIHKYEKKECAAQIALCQKGQNLDNKCILKFKYKDRVSLIDTRRVRKLLEATGKNSVLVCDGWNIIGITSNKDKDDKSSETNDPSNNIEPLDTKKTLFIKFLSHMVWEAHYEGDLIFRFQEGNIIVDDPRKKPSDVLNMEPLASKMPEGARRDKIGDLIQAAIGACHGTTLLFTENADGEAKRLKKESIRAKPFEMERDDLISLSSIDGAVVLDFNCQCHAIGTILDGETCDEADSSRGARYNSAWRYYNFRKKTEDLFLVVISEDGMVNYIYD